MSTFQNNDNLVRFDDYTLSFAKQGDKLTITLMCVVPQSDTRNLAVGTDYDVNVEGNDYLNQLSFRGRLLGTQEGMEGFEGKVRLHIRSNT